MTWYRLVFLVLLLLGLGECWERSTRLPSSPTAPYAQDAQFLTLCSRSKWSRHFTNAPFLALLAMDGAKAAYKIISACANAVS